MLQDLFNQADFISKSADNSDKKAQEARSRKYHIKPHEGGNVTKPGKYASVPDSEFADPVNYAYPIDPTHVMAAYRYFAKPENQSEYSQQERHIVAERIIAKLPKENKDEAKQNLLHKSTEGESTMTEKAAGKVEAKDNKLEKKACDKKTEKSEMVDTTTTEKATKGVETEDVLAKALEAIAANTASLNKVVETMTKAFAPKKDDKKDEDMDDKDKKAKKAKERDDKMDKNKDCDDKMKKSADTEEVDIKAELNEFKKSLLAEISSKLNGGKEVPDKSVEEGTSKAVLSKAETIDGTEGEKVEKVEKSEKEAPEKEEETQKSIYDYADDFSELIHKNYEAFTPSESDLAYSTAWNLHHSKATDKDEETVRSFFNKFNK